MKLVKITKTNKIEINVSALKSAKQSFLNKKTAGEPSDLARNYIKIQFNSPKNMARLLNRVLNKNYDGTR